MALMSAQVDHLREHAGHANSPAASTQLLAFVLEHFSNDFAVISSFGAESVVLLQLVASIRRSVPIYFLDTGRHFPQTLAYRDQLIQFLGLKDVRNLRPDPKQILHEDPDELMAQLDPDRCCHIRKVLPLEKVEGQFDIWATGRKRSQSNTRQYLPIVEEVSAGRVKLNPLAGWDEEQVRSYIQQKKLPQHPLVAKGYRSIGCEPCTRPVSEGEDSRAGRWSGQRKTECGLHASHTMPRSDHGLS